MKSLLILLPALIASATVQAQGWDMGPGGMGWNKLEMCHGCHDMGMRGGMGMGGGMGMRMMRGEMAPMLGGQHAAYLEKALKAYRSGARQHPVMNRVASMLADQEIPEITRFYAARETTGAADVVEAPTPSKARETCGACHGPHGNSASDQFPRLAGQHEAYLVAALRAYRDGRRSDAVMRPQAEKLSDREIASLAAFYAAQKGLTVKQPIWGGRGHRGDW
jgi:cytochrome c553